MRASWQPRIPRTAWRQWPSATQARRLQPRHPDAAQHARPPSTRAKRRQFRNSRIARRQWPSAMQARHLQPRHPSAAQHARPPNAQAGCEQARNPRNARQKTTVKFASEAPTVPSLHLPVSFNIHLTSSNVCKIIKTPVDSIFKILKCMLISQLWRKMRHKQTRIGPTQRKKGAPSAVKPRVRPSFNSSPAGVTGSGRRLAARMRSSHPSLTGPDGTGR